MEEQRIMDSRKKEKENLEYVIVKRRDEMKRYRAHDCRDEKEGKDGADHY